MDAVPGSPPDTSLRTPRLTETRQGKWPSQPGSVTKRFPEHELAIERLVRTSESFRSMCEDYAVGVEAL